MNPQVLAVGIKFLLEFFLTSFRYIFDVIYLVFYVFKLYLVCLKFGK